MKKLHPSLLLLIVTFLAYGLLLPQLGFYWDDLPMSWIRYQLGPDAMTEYFSTNRPVWALLYQVTTRILPHEPIYWQVNALLWRWLGAVTVWAIARKLFPARERFALTLSLLFLLYPGFNQQWVSYLYSHFFIVLFFFLFSQYLMLRGKTLPALLCSALNLWMMEYFYVLELIRPFILWTTLRDESLAAKDRLLRALNLCAPYLAVFTLSVLSRLFVFNNQIYEFNLREQFAGAPLETAVGLARNILASLWTAGLSAWALIFKFPGVDVDGPRTTAIYAVVTLAVAAAIWFGMAKQAQGPERGGREAGWIILLGLVMLALAGPPFWLTNVPISLGFPANRATLSFILGVSFVFAGLLEFLPRRVRMSVAVAALALAAGRQFLWSNEFRRDWAYQKNLFWQMTWRAPGIAENTMVLLNENLAYYADNSLGAALNWIYSSNEYDGSIEYTLFYPTNREGLSLAPDMPVGYDFLIGAFSGNTSRALVFYYAPPKCLRLLDPDIDPANRLLPDDTMLRDVAILSSSDLILKEAASVMPNAYGPEPAHGWCYYFQKAELARQNGDWRKVVILGETAFALNDTPNDPVERFVFIEAYAHAGDWKKAVELSQDSYRVSKNYVGPLLCRLWGRIERETEPTPEQVAAAGAARTEFGCNP